MVNKTDYAVMFIGYPIRWGEMPGIVATFAESYDFSGITVVTFCASGRSPNNDGAVSALAGGANRVSGTRPGSTSAQSDMAEWIDGLGLD